MLKLWTIVLLSSEGQVSIPSCLPRWYYLCHAVTLTVDLLTLNFYSSSGVVRLNSLPTLSEIEQSAAQLLTI